MPQANFNVSSQRCFVHSCAASSFGEDRHLTLILAIPPRVYMTDHGANSLATTRDMTELAPELTTRIIDFIVPEVRT